MINERKIYTIEFTVIILLWVIVIISPLLFTNYSTDNWRAAHVMWIECLIVGIAFLINRFILIPHLFFLKKYTKYAISLVCLFILISVFILYFDGVNNLISTIFNDNKPLISTPPMRGDNIIPIDNTFLLPPHRVPPKATVIPPMIMLLVVTFIVIALDLGVRIAVTWVIAEYKQSENNRERAISQLKNLQSQVSPHFFMNTLNNIHALVDIDPKLAKHTIIELSGLMSYLLYDSSRKEKIALIQELEFIESYINLMRLRYSTHVTIDYLRDNNTPSVEIPPLIFLNFIENAFKYGIDSENRSAITIRFKLTDYSIEMVTINTNHNTRDSKETHGIGISNSRKRLNLLYGDRYTLDINEEDSVFCVTLKIPII